MADEINNQTSNSGGGMGAFAWIVLLVIIVLIGWFLVRGGFGDNNDANIDVNVPDITTDGSGSGSGQ